MKPNWMKLPKLMKGVPAVQKELSRIKVRNGSYITGEELSCDGTHPRFGWDHGNSPYSLEEETEAQRSKAFCPKLWENLDSLESKSLTSDTELFPQIGHSLLASSPITVGGNTTLSLTRVVWRVFTPQRTFPENMDHLLSWHVDRVRISIATVWASTKWAWGFTDLPFKGSAIQGQSERSIHLVFANTRFWMKCSARKISWSESAFTSSVSPSSRRTLLLSYCTWELRNSPWVIFRNYYFL